MLNYHMSTSRRDSRNGQVVSVAQTGSSKFAPVYHDGNRIAHAVRVLFSVCIAVCVLWAMTVYGVSGSVAYADDSTNSSSNSSTSSSNRTSTGLTRNFQIPASADVDTWAQVAVNLNKDLDTALAAVQRGDGTTASAAFQRAFNINYMNSYMMSAAEAALGAHAAHGIHMEIESLATDSMNSAKFAEITARVETLKATVISTAASLDADANVLKPRDFAQAQAEKTSRERQALEASRTRKNEGRGTRTWTEVAVEMNSILDKALAAAKSGDGEQGADLVNKVYYSYYEKLGFEKNVMNAISGSRVSEVENEFKVARKAMLAGKSEEEISASVTKLQKMLREDGEGLDGAAGHQQNAVITFITSAFGQAAIILLREGLEALLVVAAIISYLAKAGQKKMSKYIYAGVIAGLVASGIMAAVLTFVFKSAGSYQEMIEGFTALVAMVMLLFTSNWMLSKSSTQAWNSYINEQTQVSISQGSVWSLMSLAFLAVFREGAETVIFYQALGGMISDGDYMPLWYGAGVAVIILAAIFAIFRFTSAKLPIRPFFMVTSALMSIMVVTFAGSGLHELIEADVVNGTYMSSWITNDFLGIYPYVETVVFQIVMASIVLGLLGLSWCRQKKAEVGDSGKAGKANAKNVAKNVAGVGADAEVKAESQAEESSISES